MCYVLYFCETEIFGHESIEMYVVMHNICVKNESLGKDKNLSLLRDLYWMVNLNFRQAYDDKILRENDTHSFWIFRDQLLD